MQRVHPAPLPQNTLRNVYLREELDKLTAHCQHLHEQLGLIRSFTDPRFDRRKSQDRRSGSDRRSRPPSSDPLTRDRRAIGDRRLPTPERILKLEQALASTTARQMELQAWLQNSY